MNLSMHQHNSYKRSDSTIKQDTHKKIAHDNNFGRYFLTHCNVKTKIHIVFKICIRMSMIVMKGVESSSRAKRKICRAK